MEQHAKVERLPAEVQRKIIAITGDKGLLVSPEDMACYGYDGTGLDFPPAAVAFPAATNQVAAIMAVAHQHHIPVTPRGAGTGMTGGGLAVRGGLVLAMARMNRILEIDTKNHLAVVEPGVITGALQKEVQKHGLFYPPDPASSAFCTMGGNAAECAGGPSAVKYGVTRDYVLGLTVVLADGRLLKTGVRTAKSVTGYDLTRLFIGSEGTLGIITAITVRLLPMPAASIPILVMLDSEEAAARLVNRILLAGILPRALEFLDNTVVGLVAPTLPFELPENSHAMLLVELDGATDEVDSLGKRLVSLLEQEAHVKAVRVARSKTEADAIRQARRSVSPLAFTLRPDKISEDVVVPRSRIPELAELARRMSEEYRLPILTFGHAGDGNIHVNIMLDKKKPSEQKRADQATIRLFQEVIAMGGSLSGEHGIGITKAGFMPLECDETSLAVMRAIKKTLDPTGILNPGKMLLS